MATDDEILQQLIDRTVDFVQRELDWYFGAPRAATEILDGTGTNLITVRQFIVNSSVVVSERDTVGEAWETVDTDDYEFRVGERGLYHASEWTAGKRNYRVQYTEGFETMPGDIEQLILDLVTSRWNNRDNDPGLRSEHIGDYSYTRADLEELPGWSAVFNHWRRGRI